MPDPARLPADAVTITEPPPKVHKTKLTRKVRRGLGHVRALLIDGFDDNKPPAHVTTHGWTKTVQTEFNLAMTWLEENERRAT